MEEKNPYHETLGYDYVDGRNARRQGKAPDAPNPKNSPEGRAWLQGWKDRNDEMVREGCPGTDFWLKQEHELLVTARHHDVHVCLKGMPEVWGAGHSINEALGEFVRTHAQRLGIRILFPLE